MLHLRDKRGWIEAGQGSCGLLGVFWRCSEHVAYHGGYLSPVQMTRVRSGEQLKVKGGLQVFYMRKGSVQMVGFCFGPSPADAADELDRHFVWRV